MKAAAFCTLSLALLVSVLILFACSTGGKSPSGSANVNVRVSDPATCSGPNGAFSHIYVTITDV